MPAEGDFRKSATEIYRRHSFSVAVRVERCGKSAPDGWELSVAVNSIRSNTVGGHMRLARPSSGGGLSVPATVRLDR